MVRETLPMITRSAAMILDPCGQIPSAIKLPTIRKQSQGRISDLRLMTV